jgi:hypothetical protein
MNKTVSDSLGFDDIARGIINALSPELLSPEWKARVQPGEPVVAGHCAIAAEAFYHLTGGRAAGMLPVVCSYFETRDAAMYFNMAAAPDHALRATHWWVRGPGSQGCGTGPVYDVTVGQYKGISFPYEKGRGCGFQNPYGQPSRRARIVMNRVESALGAERLARFRMEKIAAYERMAPKPTRVRITL